MWPLSNSYLKSQIGRFANRFINDERTDRTGPYKLYRPDDKLYQL